MTIRVNADRYIEAQQFVRDGYWFVDAERGHLYSARAPEVPLGSENVAGYLVTSGPNQAQVRVHRVIWEAARGPIPDGLVINHKNGVRSDNRLDNLEVVTQLENVRHSIAAGHRRHGGSRCKRGHEFTPRNTYRDARGWRQCRTCNNARARADRLAQAYA